MESERGRVKRERAALRKEYGALFERVSALLFEADPMGINFETNSDEYDSEAGTILPRLQSVASAQDVEAVVYQEFCRWFGVEQAGAKQGYRAVAASIWQEWCAFSNRQA